MKSLLLFMLVSFVGAKISSIEEANVTLPNYENYYITDLVLLGDYLVASASNPSVTSQDLSITVFDTLPGLKAKYTIDLDDQCYPQMAIINSTSVLLICQTAYDSNYIPLIFLEYSFDADGNAAAGRKAHYNYSADGFTFADDHFIGDKGGYYFTADISQTNGGKLHRFDMDKFEDEIVIDDVTSLFGQYASEASDLAVVLVSILSDEFAVMFQGLDVLVKHTFKTNKTEFALTKWGNEAGLIYSLRLEEQYNAGIVFVSNMTVEIAELWNFDTMERVGSQFTLSGNDTTSIYGAQVVKGQILVSNILQQYDPQVSSISQIFYTLSGGIQDQDLMAYEGSGSTAYFQAIAATEQQVYVSCIQTPTSSIIEYQYSTDM